MTERELDLIERESQIQDVLTGMTVIEAKTLLSIVLCKIEAGKIRFESDIMAIGV